MSSKAGRLEDLTAEWAGHKHGEAVLRVVRFDPEVAQNRDEAAVALRNGVMSSENAAHYFLIIGGELAPKMRKPNLSALVERSLRGDLLIVMGLADNDAERKALDELGVRFVLRRGAPGEDVLKQFSSARDELNSRLNAKRIEIMNSPRDCSGDRGVSDGGAQTKDGQTLLGRFGLGKKK